MFSDAGLSEDQISGLFILWSAVGFVAEVPCGALADRFSRRGVLVVAGVIQAVGYACWTALPEFGAFAAGFVLWGISGALISGAFEALLYDGLAAVQAQEHYARVQGAVSAAGLIAQLPAAAAGTVLFRLGGYALVGWVSVGCCLATSVLATRFPEPPRQVDDDDDGAGYLATLRSGLAEAASRPAVRAIAVAVALLGGLDGLEEYFPLLAQQWGVPTDLVPVAVLAIPVVGAIGAACAGLANRLKPRWLALLMGAAVLVLTLSGVLGRPVALAGVAIFYGLYQLVLVTAYARLQHSIDGGFRATVTSVAALGEELAAISIYLLWAGGGLAYVVVFAYVIAMVLAPLLRR